jgi:hypothetical protein
MRVQMGKGAWFVAAALLSCSSGENAPGAAAPDAGLRPAPKEPRSPEPASGLPGDILDTTLAVELRTRTAVATLRVAPSSEQQAFEVGDLDIRSVHIAGVPLAWSRRSTFLDLTLPASEAPLDVSFEYGFDVNADEGVASTGYTYTWPYWCGNAFPCRSAPSEGMTFHLSVTAASGIALYPTEIPSDAPSYMLAWSTGDYVRRSLGTTSAGTNVSTWHVPATEAFEDPDYLTAAFDWMEQNLGPYRFGAEVGSVVAPWGGSRGAGGIETHPYWQVGRADWDDEATHIHEAAHGWFGNGVRLRCWEDFVLSEGTASYLAARVLQEVGSPMLAYALWATYDSVADEPAVSNGRAWPSSSCQIDILDPGVGLVSRVPYVKGALFLRALERRIGRPALDQGLKTFYARWAGHAAGMQDMLDVICETSGYDPTPCAKSWLQTRSTPSAACP